MKQFLVLFTLLFFFCSCAPSKKVVDSSFSSTPDQSVSSAPIAPPEMPPAPKIVTPLFGELLSGVSTSKTSFNPSQHEDAALTFSLSQPAKVSIRVYDPDQNQIGDLMMNKQMAAGTHTAVWDGRDLENGTVPDEVYFFTIVAEDGSGKKEIYDPTTFSGGEEYDITQVDIDPESHTITYTMPEMGRVMVRIGIQGGPLMNQLVDWKPRIKGAITEHWNGKDRDNLVDIYDHPKFKMIISYFTLPEHSVITYGNNKLSFLDYKKNLKAQRFSKPERESSISRFSQHYRIPRTEDYSPAVTLDFVNPKGKTDSGIPIIHGKAMVKVALAQEDKSIFQNQQFEVCFFLDHVFYAEDETGYTPFNWVWDLQDVTEGEHLLTVNLSGFKDQIGLISKKVMVVK